MEPREIRLHGHRLRYRVAGRGPLLLLIHGIAGRSATWEDVAPALARRFTVLAPDLPGHGASAKPRGDYSIGAHANTLRDLAGALGFERGSVVGHSLGGGIAMQFAYQFPERCERLVLVSSGGLGREVHALLRSATLPGAELVLPLLFNEGTRRSVDSVTRWVGRLGLRPAGDLDELRQAFASLREPAARRAFLSTARSVIDARGQRVDATNRLYLAGDLPTLIVWGERDALIPVRHAHAAHQRIPGSRLAVFPGAGHFPHRSHPERFADVLLDFLETTRPARLSESRLRERLLEDAEPAGAARPRPFEPAPPPNAA
jgi:pimeloyl-ACP methyl ester carboxylesterase